MDADTAPAGSPYEHERLTERVLGCFFDVYNELGYGFLESVYENAMAVALEQAQVSFNRQASLPVNFRGRRIAVFRPDLVVAGVVILEVKSASAVHDSHSAQLLNYLRCSDVEIGLLLNFGPKPEFKRLAFANSRKICVHLR